MRRNSLTMRGNPSSERPQASSAGVVANRLKAGHAFVFGIDLQRQSAAMRLKIVRPYVGLSTATSRSAVCPSASSIWDDV
jgi:hypothetical protein